MEEEEEARVITCKLPKYVLEYQYITTKTIAKRLQPILVLPTCVKPNHPLVQMKNHATHFQNATVPPQINK